MSLFALIPRRRVVRHVIDGRKLRMVGWYWLGHAIVGPNLYDDGAA